MLEACITYGRTINENPIRGDLTPDMKTTGRETGLTARCQATARHEARNNCVPCVLFLSIPFHSAVKCGEHATPNAEVATCDGCTRFDGRNGTSEALALIISVFNVSVMLLSAAMTSGGYVLSVNSEHLLYHARCHHRRHPWQKHPQSH